MSANNWAVCPACKIKIKDEIDALDQRLAEAYGKVPVEEFDVIRDKRHSLDVELADPPRTLREDYEVSIDSSGRFQVSYGASCTTCTFSHSFTHAEQLRVDGPVPR